jgi:ABC-type sugar transport system ATPase subunit
MASVDLQHVDKIYPGGTVGISDCTLHVNDGELMVVVGPSGCGKSTVLRLVAGLEAVTRGELRIGDRLVNDLSPQERNVAMVFQDYALYPYRTVRGNLEFPLRMRRVTAEEMSRRVEWVAGLLEIAPLLDRLPKQLSGGQRQRVAMGRALVREPAVSLLDEPLSNLDARLRGQVRAEIGELQRRTGTTMIYVTHDQVEAMTLGHRVTVLDRGRLQQVARPRELYERPVNAFVAGFIGNPPMNLFPTSVAGDAVDRLTMTIGDQRTPVAAGRVPSAILDRIAGRALTAGVRPEAVSLDGDRAPIRGIVEQLELLGHETVVSLRVGEGEKGVRLLARVPSIPDFDRGSTIAIRIDPAEVYLFDESGDSLGRAE